MMIGSIKKTQRNIKKDIGYTNDDIYILDDESPMSDSDTFVDINGEIGDTSGSDTYIDTDHSDNDSTIHVTPVKVGRDLDSSAAMTPKVKSMRRYLMSPILRRRYYGRKGQEGGTDILYPAPSNILPGPLYKHLPGRSHSTPC